MAFFDEKHEDDVTGDVTGPLVALKLQPDEMRRSERSREVVRFYNREGRQW
jgi:hypothetical protein